MKFPFGSTPGPIAAPLVPNGAAQPAPSGMEMMAMSMLSKLGIDPQKIFGFLGTAQAVLEDANERLARIEEQQSTILAELRAIRGSDDSGASV